MRVFVTGASGFIGSAVVKELSNAGHQVIGLARSDESAKLIIAAGGSVHPGNLDDTASLKSGAAKADAVIHLGFQHDFSRFAEAAEMDRLAIEALGEELAGTDRHLIVSSGIGTRYGGQVATEDTDALANPRHPRVSEKAALGLLSKGVRVSVVRLPQVHDTAKQGLVMQLIAVARAKGVSAYTGGGLNQWAAGHVLDVAQLYRLVLERGTVAGRRYHAVGEEGVSLKDIATALGKRLNLPVQSKPKEEAAAHFGFVALFAGAHMPASSQLTQQWLGWKPNHIGLIEDLDNGTF